MPFSTHPSGVKVYVLVLRIREYVVAECEGKRVQVLKTFIETSFKGWIFSFFVAKVSRAHTAQQKTMKKKDFFSSKRF